MPHPFSRNINGDTGSGHRLTTRSHTRSDSERPPVTVEKEGSVPNRGAVDLTKSSHTFSTHQQSSTPMGRTTHASDTTIPGLAEQKRVIMEELGGSISEASDAFATSLYAGVATDTEIEAFLKASPLYNRSRWVLPRNLKKESQLYDPLAEIVSSILREFGLSDTSRWVQDSHAAHLQHHEDKSGTPDYSSPDLVILASGPSFDATPPVSSGYAGTYGDVAACLEVKLDRARGSVNENVQQLGIYARCG